MTMTPASNPLSGASEDRLAGLVVRNAGDLAIFVIDVAGFIVSWNRGAESILGWTAAEAIGRHFEMFFLPEDREAGQPQLEMRLAAEQGTAEDARWHVKVDGTWFWASGQLTAMRDDDELVGYAKVLRDRTEQRQTHQHLQMAQRAGAVGSFELLPKNGIIFPSQEFSRLWGVPHRDQCAVNDFISLIHADDRDKVVTGNPVLPADALDYTEYRIVRPDTKEIRWIARRGELVYDEVTKSPRYIGVTYDITQRKRTEYDLRFLAKASIELAGLADRKDTLRRLAFLAVPLFSDWCAVDLVQADGTLDRVAVAHVDPAMVQFAHEFHRRFPPDPSMKMGVWNVIRTGRSEMISEITDENLKQVVLEPERFNAIRKLGFKSYLGIPLSVKGEVIGVVIFVSAESGRRYNQADLSLAEDLGRRVATALENATLYEKLRQADTDKDVFLATLAHELRNPLSAITNGLSVLQLASDRKDRIEHAVKLMQRQANQLTRLVDDLMDVSRITTGKIGLKKERTSLAEILNSAIEMSRVAIDAGNHSLTLEIPAIPTPVLADPLRLAQVFSNLITNAAKYTDSGGTITITLATISDHFVVRIRDTGVGIPAAMIGDIFKKFTQVSHPIERSQGGLGIGLSLVQGLVGLHGGHVQAFSAGEGKGSEFSVFFPQLVTETIQGNQYPDASTNEASPNRTGLRVLVVDDNVDAATTLAEVLELLGHTVCTAHDGPDALSKIAHTALDVVLMDIGLPGLDGYEVAQLIRSDRSCQDLTLIALTGWGLDKDKKRSTDAGFDAHWVKPVDFERLENLSVLRGVR